MEMRKQLGTILAREIFKLGHGPGEPTQRIALKGGTWPFKETDRGGLNERALAEFIQKKLDEML